MSPADVSAAEADEQLEIQTGRRAPYTQVGDWVALSTVSPQAKTLYWVLSAHVNVSRGDREVWPSRATLAGMLGLAQARSVDPYLVELERLGAVTTARAEKGKGATGPRRNVYSIHQTPPPGFAGHVSLSDWYRERREERAARTKAEAAELVRSSAPPERVMRSSAPEVVQPSAPEVVRPTAHEQEVLTGDEGGVLSPAATHDRRQPVRGRASAATAPASNGAELALIPPPPGAVATTPKVTGRDVASAWVDAYRASIGAEPTRHQVGQVARESKALLEAGNRADRVLYAARSVASRGKALVTAEFADLSAAARGRATAKPAARRSTTDERVSQGADLIAYYASLENEEAASR